MKEGQLVGLKCPCTMWDDNLNFIVEEELGPGDLLIVLKMRHPNSGKRHVARRYSDFAKVMTQYGTLGWIYRKFLESEII